MNVSYWPKADLHRGWKAECQNILQWQATDGSPNVGFQPIANLAVISNTIIISGHRRVRKGKHVTYAMDMERPGRCYPAAVLVEPAIACFGRLWPLYMLKLLPSTSENVFSAHPI